MDSPIAQKVKTFFTAYPRRIFTARQVVLRAGESVPRVFYIADGRVSQYDITPAGNEVVVNVFKAGAFLPMSSAINNTPNNYFFEASTKVTAHVAPAAEAVQFLKDNPDVLFDLLARVYKGTDGILRRMAHLMSGDTKNRLLFELLNAVYRFGQNQPDGSVHIALKETDLAKRAGLARETVSRTLKQLKDANLVTISSDGITVRSVSALETLLGDAL